MIRFQCHRSSVRSRSLLSSSSLKELPCLVFFTPWEAERLRNPFHLCFVFFQMWSHSSPNPGIPARRHSQVSRVSTCQWVRCTLSRSELSSSSCRAPEELWTTWRSCFSPAKASIRSRLRIFTTAGLRRTNRWGERKASWAFTSSLQSL